MQFVHSGFLWALTALAIPVIIHLFNFRRYKTVYFSNVRFLREVIEQTSNSSKLKHYLVLACRLLALSLLVLAFAQPYFPNKKAQGSTGKKAVSIYIDNSFSMNAMSGGRSLFDKAKQAAKEIAKNYGAEDRFQLLTNDFWGKHQRMVGKEEFIALADEVEISPAVRSLAEITKRQKDALSREGSNNQVAYLLSDFQSNMGPLAVDSFVSYNLIPFAADAQQNVYIDTCWFSQPVQLLNQPTQLIVKVSNSGEKAVEDNHLTLKLNGQTKTMADVNIAAGGSVYDTLNFVPQAVGWNKAELAIQDYPINYDDNYFISFYTVEKIHVLSLYENRANVFLDALFKDQPEFDYTSMAAGAFDPQQLMAKQLVVVDGLNNISGSLSAALSNNVAGGGSVAVFPGDKIETESYNRFLNNMQANSIIGLVEQPQDLAGINLQQNIFKDVFEKVPQNLSLPNARKYYSFSKNTISNEEAILTLKDGSSFISRYPYKLGSLFVSAVPLDKSFSDLPVHALFVPMIYKMAVMNIKGAGIAYFIGDKTRVEVDVPAGAGEKVYKIKGDNLEFVPEQFAVGNKILLGPGTELKKPGFYTASPENSDTAQILAFNYDRKESDLHFYDAAQLRETYNQKNVNVVNAANTEVAAVVKELDRGTAIWKLCLILSLLFFAAETALLRIWKA